METEIQDVLSDMWLEACKNGRTVSFRIASGSMHPFIEIGDIVRVRHVKAYEIRAGDIVAFKNGQNVIVHRIVRVDRSNGSAKFYQMGDAGGIPVSLQATNIIGKVNAINRNGREVRLDSPGQVIGSRLFVWRSLLIDSARRRSHVNVNRGIRFFLKPAWRLCRKVIIWLS